MATNNDFLSDLSGSDRGSGLTNNQLLEIISSNGSSAGLTTEERERLDSIANKADLVGGKVPESQLPSYIDNVQEYANQAAFPATGENNVIYVDTSNNTAHRWSGTGYIQLSSGLVLGETSSSAMRGDQGKVAYDHTLLVNNPHQVTKGQIGLGNVNNTSDAEKPISSPQFAALATKENLITPSSGNVYFRGDKTWQPLTKELVGLGNVDNTPDADKPITQALLNAFSAKADLLNGKVPASQLPTSTAGLELGDTSTTAGRGDRAATSFAHTSRTDNPHSVTASQVGLGNVNNTADSAKPVSNATQTALNAKINIPSVNGAVPVINLSGQVTHIPYANGLGASTIPTRGPGSNFDVGTPLTAAQVANKAYVDATINPIATTTAQGVTTKEYSNRFEYTFKYAINQSVSSSPSNYASVATGIFLPVGVTIAGCDEHYISVSQNNRAIDVSVWDNSTTRQITMGLFNSFAGGANTSVGSIFGKLVKFK